MNSPAMIRQPTSEILDRLPPQDVDAEKQFLGCCLLDPKILDEAVGLVRADEFYADAHQKLWGHICAMHDAHQAIDASLLAARLKDAGDAEAVGGAAYLAEVLQCVPVAAHYRYYAARIVKMARLRTIIHTATEMLRSSWEPGAEPKEVLNAAEAALQAIQTGDYQDVPVTAQQAAEEFLAKVDRICDRQGQVGVFTGLSRFDFEVGGLFPGELTILAARPSVGKTALACQIADYASGRNRLVYVASLEMRFVELTGRSICSLSEVNSKAIRTGNIGPAERHALVDGANAYARQALRIDTRPRLTVYDIRRATRRLAKEGLQLVVIDYLQLLTPENPKLQRYEQIGQQTKALKELACELEIPILCLCQLNRAAEQKDTPTLANLRESGSIEQDADTVMLLHRPPEGIQIPTPGNPKKKEKAAWPAELILAKNRNGEQVNLRLKWDPQFTRFSCWDEEVPNLF